MRSIPEPALSEAVEEPSVRGSDLGGLGQLAVAATLGVTDLVEALHHTIARGTAPLGPPPAGRTGGLTGLVYGSVRGITRGVGGLLDLGLKPLARWRAGSGSSETRDTWRSALNGVLGDWLAATGNALKLDMQLLQDGRPRQPALAPASANRDLLVLVHGLCMHPGQWRRAGHDHGAALAVDLGLQPLYLHYNTGLDLAQNGRAFCAQLTELVEHWPVPVRSLHLLGHSMGGLVIRAALRQAARRKANWLSTLRSLVFLGTPHRGSPIERAGHWLQSVLAHSPYALPFTALGQLRSAGIQDLRHGRIGGRGPVALPAGVPALAVAGCGGPEGATSLRERLLGDGLVPVASALGRATRAGQTDLFAAAQQQLLYGVDHFGLLDAEPVYPLLRSFVGGQLS